jgi:hypothetical protein
MRNEINTAGVGVTTPALVLFPLGHLFITPGAAGALEEAGQSPREFVGRHARLEQGALSDEDHRENLFSVDKPLRIFSAFRTERGVKVWVITEADRSATTILLPDEY